MYSYIRYQQLTADQTANLLGSSSGTVFLVMNCVTILDVVSFVLLLSGLSAEPPFCHFCGH